MANETMRIEEAARYLKLDVWEVEAAIESHELPSVVLGGETLVDWRRLMGCSQHLTVPGHDAGRVAGAAGRD